MRWSHSAGWPAARRTLDRSRRSGGATGAEAASSPVMISAGTRLDWDPAADPAFPKDMVLSELGAMEWSRDGARLFLGVKPQQDKVEEPPAGSDPKANVEIWHWGDDRLLSVQKIQADADRRATCPLRSNLADRHFVQLGDADMPRLLTHARRPLGHGRERQALHPRLG